MVLSVFGFQRADRDLAGRGPFVFVLLESVELTGCADFSSNLGHFQQLFLHATFFNAVIIFMLFFTTPSKKIGIFDGGP